MNEHKNNNKMFSFVFHDLQSISILNRRWSLEAVKTIYR